MSSATNNDVEESSWLETKATFLGALVEIVEVKTKLNSPIHVIESVACPLWHNNTMKNNVLFLGLQQLTMGDPVRQDISTNSFRPYYIMVDDPSLTISVCISRNVSSQCMT